MNTLIEPRKKVNRNQKAWKFVRDVNAISLDKLNDVAIHDGMQKYTYGQMFREWERYAAVFSSLGMTSMNKSRVGILGSTSPEVIFAIYGLNMTGADVSVVPSYSAFFPHKIMDSIRSEKLTDFIVTDDFTSHELINEIMLHRNELGINNIILLHVHVGGVTVNPALTVMQEMKYLQFRSYYGPICMDELLKAYGNNPISYATEKCSDTAFILHTSGTTSGAGKPVAISDIAFNESAASFYELEDLDLPYDNLVTAVIVDLSNAYGIVDQVHLPFVMGASVVFNPGGVLNPWFYKAIPEYKISFLFTISAMFERWMKMAEKKDLDFTSLRFVAIGGSSVSAADKRRYYEFMRKHGAGHISILNGYGISELAGACCLSTPDIDDESIGYPLPGVKVRLYDEESQRFLPEGKKNCEGVMYLNSPSVATVKLDGKDILKAEYINQKAYICTNDLVRIEEDGRIQFLGRANRFFINQEGRKYQAGRVETEVARQSGIENCCVVPVYIKTTHDNMPMLCVQPLAGKGNGKELVCKALRQVFIVERTLPEDHIPFRVMIVEKLPRNGNGKIDLYKIGRGEVTGDVYSVECKKLLKRLSDIKLKPYKNEKADMIKEVFDGISKELKSNISIYKMDNDERQVDENMDNMNSAKKAFDTFNSMNRMGMQMMNNMIGKVSGIQNMPGMPNMPGMQNMMNCFQNMVPNMHNMMPNMQNMMGNFQNMMPGMQNMMGMMNNIPGNAQKMSQNMGSVMQQQMQLMMEWMTQMNQFTMETMQKMYEQNYKMMGQFFSSMQQMTDTFKPAAPAAPATQEEIKPEPEKDAEPEKAPAPKKRTSKKAPAKAAAKTTKAKTVKKKAPVNVEDKPAENKEN